MKKQLCILLLCICALAAALSVPASGAAGGSVTFIAVNENLLELSSQPFFSDGVTYLPYWAFTDYGFNIYYSYFSDASTAMLYNSDKQVFFDIENGTTYDLKDNRFNVRALMRGGVVYVPATFVCNYFGGITTTLILGSGYGDIVRLKDSRSFLDDASFIRVASTLMRSRYEQYTAALATPSPALSPTPAPGPAPTPSPSPSPEVPEEHPHEGQLVYLSFVGLPSETILSALSYSHTRACFFLSPEHILSGPELVRRLAYEGHSLGVLCGEDAPGDYDRALELLFACARTRTVLVTALGSEAESCQSWAAEEGLVFWVCDVDGVSDENAAVYLTALTDAFSEKQTASSLFLSCDRPTERLIYALLRYFADERFALRPPQATESFSA